MLRSCVSLSPKQLHMTTPYAKITLNHPSGCRPYRKTKFTVVGINPTTDSLEGPLLRKMVAKAKRLFNEGAERGDFYRYREVDIVFYFSGITISCDYIVAGVGLIAHKSLKS